VLNLTIDGDEELIAALQGRKEQLIASLTSNMEAFQKLLADRVRVNLSGAVLQTRSGNLLDSVQEGDVVVTGGVVETTAVTAGGEQAPYGAIQEAGSETGEFYQIVPTKAKALAWISDSGERVIRRSVMHPPIVAKPFLAPAAEEMEPTFQAMFADAILEALG
jgi:hypothetical protein